MSDIKHSLRGWLLRGGYWELADKLLGDMESPLFPADALRAEVERLAGVAESFRLELAAEEEQRMKAEAEVERLKAKVENQRAEIVRLAKPKPKRRRSECALCERGVPHRTCS